MSRSGTVADCRPSTQLRRRCRGSESVARSRRSLCRSSAEVRRPTGRWRRRGDTGRGMPPTRPHPCRRSRSCRRRSRGADVAAQPVTAAAARRGGACCRGAPACCGPGAAVPSKPRGGLGKVDGQETRSAVGGHVQEGEETAAAGGGLQGLLRVPGVDFPHSSASRAGHQSRRTCADPAREDGCRPGRDDGGSGTRC